MGKISPTNLIWKEFEIGNLFEIKKVYGKPESTYKDGEIPYISTSGVNNGVILFKSNIGEREISKGNCISVDPINVKCFYHIYDFIGRGYSGASINLLYSKFLNKYNSKFIITAIEKANKEKASYGYLFNGNRLKKGKLLLPTDEKGNPNWKYMEDYIKQETKIQTQKIISYYKNKLNDILSDFDLEKFKAVKYKNKKWNIFSIDDLFTIKIGKNIDGNKIQDNLGNTPYVTRKTTDNGLENFIDGYNEKYLFKEVPVITIGNETAKPFVQNKSFYTGTKVNILKPKENHNINVLKFICNTLENSCDRYSYSFTINSTRLKKEKIILPVKDDDETRIDWEYMSNFIASIEKDKIEKVLEYIYIYI